MTFNPSLKNALFFFAFGFLFGIFISYTWAQMLIPEYRLTAKVESPKELVKQVLATEKVYAQKNDSLNVQTKWLQAELSTTKSALAKAKERSAALQRQTMVLLDERLEARRHTISDTLFDSLANTIPLLISASQERDSLYSSVINNLGNQVQNKDSIIAIHEIRYVDLKSAFTKSIEAQNILISDNEALTKSIKKHQAKNKVVKAALFILSGAAATYLLRH